MQEVSSKKMKWLDIKEPNADDVLKIQKKYNLHPLVVEEFFTPTMRPKASEYGDCMYLAIHIPLFDTENRTTYPGEVDIVISQDTLITAHDKDIYQLTEFYKGLRKSKVKRDKYMNKTPGDLLYSIMEMLLESCFPKLDHISEKLNHIEDEIFAGHEKEMVIEISLAKRDILNFRRTMKPQRTVFESLASKTYRLIEPGTKAYFQDLVGTNIRVWNLLESAKETVESLEATNNSLLSNKLDLTMKVLTIFSAVLLPMTVYSNILAMSAEIPFGRNPYGFWIHMAILFCIGFFTVVMFRVKKWW